MRAVRLAVLLLFVSFAAQAAIFTVTNTNDSGPGSLRDAINSVVASNDPTNTIAFSIGSGPVTIRPQFQYAYLVKPVTIDGTTQPGYSGTPIVELDGSLITGTIPNVGLRLAGGNSTVRGLVVNGWNNSSGVVGLSASAGISLASSNNQVYANYIGTDRSGTVARKNGIGVKIESGCANNVIGGSSSSLRNIISGNDTGIEAIVVSGGNPPSTGHVIRGNWIGLSVTGSALPNREGVTLQSTDGVLVGGTGSGDGNLFSDAAADLLLNGSSNAVVQGNRFGISGGAWVGGTDINIGYGQNNLIGGTAPGAGNTLVAGNYNGVNIQDSNNNRVQGNTILNTVMPVRIASVNGPNLANNNLIGGTADGAGNTIRGIYPNSVGNGIALYKVTGCSLLRNTITNSPLLGIDLDEDGVTKNDSGDGDSGANNRQNFPVITSASSTGGSTFITGTLNSTPSSSFRVELFSNQACSASGYGEAETYLGYTTVTTDGSGNAAFSVTLPGSVPSGYVITSTATDSAGNTSELSACTAVTAGVAGEISLASSAISVNEGNTTATLTVVRTLGAVGAVSVNYATANGTATAGSDYTAASGTLAFAEGEMTKTISIHILDDSAVEGNESFTLALSAPTGGASLGTPSSATITIIDDDAPPSVSIADARVTEGDSGTTPATFTVTLSAAATTPATVQWATSPGSATAGVDYQSASGTLTFGVGESQKTITVLVNGDTTFEPDETFSVTLSNPTAATIARGTATGTIVNDDARPTVTADDVRVTEGNSGTKQAVVTLTSPQPLTGSVAYTTVAGTALPGSDFVYASGTVTFTSQTQAQIAVTINGDTAAEPDEQLTLHLTSSDFLVARPDVTITILNDDVGISPATQTIQKGATGSIYADIGNAATSVQTLAVSANDPCIRVPASVDVAAGAHAASFSVTAVTAPCSARVDVKFPPTVGGQTLSATVRTVQPFELRFDPPSLQLMTGHEVNVHVTASPLDAPFDMPLAAVTGTVSVPQSVHVDANGGSFTVKGIEAGPIVIDATLPPQYGGGIAVLSGEVTQAPKVLSIVKVAPSSGPIAGGTVVTLTGTNFRADCSVSFGGTPATAVTFGSETSMTATTPAHVAGAVDVTASCGSESTTLPGGYSYLAAAPSIHVVAPAFGSTAGGTTVHINGRNIQPGCWAFFDGVAARSVNVLNDVEMIANTPAHAEGSVPVSIRCTGTEEAVLADGFTYTPVADPAPVITSIEPLAAAPGDHVTIHGARLRKSDSVSFDAAPAVIESSAPEAHVVIVPALPPGKVAINVTDAAGHVSTTGPIFTVLEPKPQVTAISPLSAPAGAELTIDGSGFAEPYKPAIDGTAAPAVTMSYTRTVVRIPPVALGAHEVGFVSGDGKLAAHGGTVNVVTNGIVIASAAPVCATTDGGTKVTLTGSGFAPGAIVTIDGATPPNVTIVDAAHITLTLPLLKPGFATIVVKNPNGDFGTATNALRIFSPFDPDGCGVNVRPRPSHR